MIELGVAGRPAAGETQSGDDFVVETVGDSTLVAVIDGLGHGPEAAEATNRAADHLTEHAGLPLVTLVETCHRALRKTRGVVLAVARLDGADDALSWVGVGNIEARLFRSGRDWGQSDTLIMRGGVVGYQISGLRVRSVDLRRGDFLMMTTDGIRSGYAEALHPTRSVQETADHVLAGYAGGSDDALVLVCRYVGGSS